MNTCIELSRRYYYCSTCKAGYYPLDRYLGVENINYSEDFALAVGHFTAITTSFADCQKAFKYAHLAKASTTFIQKVANKLGNIGIQEENSLMKKGIGHAKKEGANVSSSEIFAVLMDGGRCQLLEDKKPKWREVKLGGFCQYQRIKNKKGVIEPKKKHCDFVGRVLEESKDFGDRLWHEAIRYGYENGETKVFLGDGAPHNWVIQENYFSDAIPILDYYHASEHLAEAVKIAVGEGTEEFKKYYDILKNSLYVGDWETIKKWTKKEAGKIKNIKNKNDLLTEGEYFYNNRNRINYESFEKLNLPIGSGVIESGIKQTVNKRIKGTEKHWLKNNANNILKLRINEISGTMHKLCQLEKLAA